MMEAMLSLPIAADHPAFPGHFPGMPVVPGVVLLDEVIHMLEQTYGMNVVQIVQAKFLSPVRPGESVHLRHERGSDGACRFYLSCAERTIATGVLRMKESGRQG